MSEIAISGVHQHALLNLAGFQFLAGNTVVAQKTLNEAITVARTNGDKAILEHCIRCPEVCHCDNSLNSPPASPDE